MSEQQLFACYLQEVDEMLVGLKRKQREEIKRESLAHLQDAAAELIKLDSPGPVFFEMPAVGQYGRRFALYKLRTMVHGSDHPHLTRIGAWLRSATIDELPLLLNVLKGDMSIFGPRVLHPYDLDMSDPLCRRILLLPPGACSPSVAFYGFPRPALKEQLEVDMYYAEQRSFSYDMHLIAGTLKQALLRWAKGENNGTGL